MKTLRFILTLFLSVALAAGVMTAIQSCSKDEGTVKPEPTPVVETPEEIILAVQDIYTIKSIDRGSEYWRIIFDDPVPVTVKKEHPEGIDRVVLYRKDGTLKEGPKYVDFKFTDGKTARMTWNNWIVASLDTMKVSFNPDLAGKSGTDRYVSVKVQQAGRDGEGSLRRALTAFYEGLNGRDWLRSANWCTDRPLHEWEGVSCLNVHPAMYFELDHKVYYGTDEKWSLEFRANNMRGTIPDEFWRAAKHFYSIRMTREYLPSVTVPDEFWNGNLQVVDFSTTFMNVPLPLVTEPTAMSDKRNGRGYVSCILCI